MPRPAWPEATGWAWGSGVGWGAGIGAEPAWNVPSECGPEPPRLPQLPVDRSTLRVNAGKFTQGSASPEYHFSGRMFRMLALDRHMRDS